MSWIKDITNPEVRQWEDFYRNRWTHDKVVRSTHGVNCTGSCSWNIHVKNGLVSWELQALDYPRFSSDVPPYEPRGCQRGISFSWYLYSPLRVKYPYVRGVLWDLWTEAKARFPKDPLAAWGFIVSDPEKRQKYHTARGKGGFRRGTWEELTELIAASNLYTIKTHGPDRVVGFSPIPAMSMISYAAGSRFLQLMGGVSLSFYDWYCDLPPASPEVWGEQTDVAESADWYHSKFIAVVGSNPFMTRTPDAHFLVEAKHNGSKLVVFSPDFNQVAKGADQWVPIHAGQDSAFWMAVTHVILREWYVEKKTAYFEDYLRRQTDAPFLVCLEPGENGTHRAGAYLRASQFGNNAKRENAEWKFFIWDEGSDHPLMPAGTVGHRWQKKKGSWNLKWKTEDGTDFVPRLSFLEKHDGVESLELPDFTDGESGAKLTRRVPVRRVKTENGEVLVTTCFDLMCAQYGVFRGLPGEKPVDYKDGGHPYTPAWQEPFTGISAEDVIRFAREWTNTAEQTKGKCSVIIGAGANHWYHNNLVYRSIISAQMLTGCIGVSGGGLNHYVGQEKLAPISAWAPLAFGSDWKIPPRLQNAPSYHYMHSDQWRYDKKFGDVCNVADPKHRMTTGHTVDQQIRAVRNGWLPCYPQFNRPNHHILAEAKAAGHTTEAAVVEYIVGELKARRLRFAMEDPDNEASFPRVWYIWRGNALLSSAKGHEFFLKHYLGTHTNAIAPEIDRSEVKEVNWVDKLPMGKLDLVVDLNFRMDTSALYSDIVLPAATFYEKDDLNSTDLHTFIHPLQKAVTPCWESKSDWEIFRNIALATETMAKQFLPDPVPDVLLTPLLHDTPAEMAQPTVKDWIDGEYEAIPGKTMPNIKVVSRDITQVYQKFISLGEGVRESGLGVHGCVYPVDDLYDAYHEGHPVEKWNGKNYPSLKNDRDVCEYILHFAPETNGELAHRAFEAESHKTGLDLSHLSRDNRGVRMKFDDLVAQPKRYLTTPYWTGNINGGRTYNAYVLNVEEGIPWRTLSGRQHFYLDHEAYRAYGENLPTHKARIQPEKYGDFDKTRPDSMLLNYLTPHGKWEIHSTYGDTLRMRTLSRGLEPFWMNDKDAAMLGIVDNDWVEVHNDNGVVCTRANVSARIPRGICMIYHSPERTLSVPKSPLRGNRRAGGHNSLTRIRLKPLLMIGGYGQFSYGFNYWGPTGVNRETHVTVRKMTKVVF